MNGCRWLGCNRQFWCKSKRARNVLPPVHDKRGAVCPLFDHRVDCTGCASKLSRSVHRRCHRLEQSGLIKTSHFVANTCIKRIALECLRCGHCSSTLRLRNNASILGQLIGSQIKKDRIVNYSQQPWFSSCRSWLPSSAFWPWQRAARSASAARPCAP